MKMTFFNFMNFLARPKSLVGLLIILTLLFSGFIVVDRKYSADSATLSQMSVSEENFQDKTLSGQQAQQQKLMSRDYARSIIIILFSLVSLLTVVSLVWNYYHQTDVSPLSGGAG